MKSAASTIVGDPLGLLHAVAVGDVDAQRKAVLGRQRLAVPGVDQHDARIARGRARGRRPRRSRRRRADARSAPAAAARRLCRTSRNGAPVQSVVPMSGPPTGFETQARVTNRSTDGKSALSCCEGERRPACATRPLMRSRQDEPVDLRRREVDVDAVVVGDRRVLGARARHRLDGRVRRWGTGWAP